MDTSGAYVIGYTNSVNFPTSNAYQPNRAGSYDIFLSKLSAAGNSLTYSTYLGGTGADYITSYQYGGKKIAVDSNGNAYVTGYTNSSNFPTKDPYQGSEPGNKDAFVSKLSSTGNALVFSTYLGGDSIDYTCGIAVDSTGVYIAGYTNSTNFPTKNAYQGSPVGDYDAFVTKFSPAGALSYSTYLGGSLNDYGYDIAVDASENPHVTGYTDSNSFPTQNPYQGSRAGGSDVFITKFSSTGNTLTYSTYLGGGSSDYGYGIAVDALDNAYVTGKSNSDDFPTQNPYQSTWAGGFDVVITKLSLAGNTLTYSTYLGGSGNDLGYGIAADSSGNAYVTGETVSTDFPTQNPYQRSLIGFETSDAFVLKYQGGEASTVTTTTPSAISSISAMSGGNVTADGGAPVTARGVCWRTSEDPTTRDNHTTDGTGTGAFTSILTDLDRNETYYVRAYATNSAGTSYGSNKSFSTLPAISPGTYYVDIQNQNGSDSNDGSSDSPWKTLHHAFDQISGGGAGSTGNSYVLHVLLGATYSTGNGEANRELAISQSYVTIIGESGSKPTISGPSSGDWEYGIKVTGSHVTLKNLNITGFTREYRTGIEIVSGPEANSTNNTIENCRVYGNYDGISISESDVFTIQDSEIDNNEVDGISISYCSNTDENSIITRNMVHDNNDGSNSDGIIVQACSPEISRNKIYDNHFNLSVQAYSNEITSPIIKNNLIYEDTLGRVDYGILIGSNDTSQVIPEIYHNTIDGGLYDGIYMQKEEDSQSTLTPRIKYNIITNFRGGGIFDFNAWANPTINYNDVWNNGSDASKNYQGCEAGAKDISLDPKYASYSLQSGSPCINKIPSSENDPVILDYPGFTRPRPGKTTKDMGAYEYVANVTNNYTLPGGTGVVTSYRIFTVPLNLGTGADMLTAMENVLGTYDPVHWRGFLYTGTLYREFNSSQFASATIKPGMGFWIITTYTSQIPFQGGPAPDGVDYVMTLDPGWHLIALPWTSTRISLGNMTVTDGIYSYTVTSDDNNLTQ